MGEFSIWHWMVVLLVVLLLFGGGKVSGLMGDLAKGIKAFKSNMADEPAASRDSEAARRSESLAGPVGAVPAAATLREAAAAAAPPPAAAHDTRTTPGGREAAMAERETIPAH